MRKALAVAILALPSLVSAQAVHSVSHQIASIEAPAFAFQTGAIKAGTPRVFTGLIAPIRMTDLQIGASVAALREGEVVVSYTVNTAGVPENVQVVKTFDETTNRRVIEAVSKMRYTPGQLDGQPIAVPITLHIALTSR